MSVSYVLGSILGTLQESRQGPLRERWESQKINRRINTRSRLCVVMNVQKKINRERLPRTWGSYMEKLFRKDLPAMAASTPRAEGCDEGDIRTS